MSREVMQQALDALAFAYNACESEWVQDEKIQPAMDAIETALAAPQPAAQPAKPLTNEQIEKFYGGGSPMVFEIIRAIEAAHGITGETT